MAHDNKSSEQTKTTKLNPKKRMMRLFFGWVFLILGFLGLFLPVLQGILFLVIAVILLSPEIPLFRKLLNWMRKRYPRIAKNADKIVGGIEE